MVPLLFAGFLGLLFGALLKLDRLNFSLIGEVTTPEISVFEEEELLLTISDFIERLSDESKASSFRRFAGVSG